MRGVRAVRVRGVRVRTVMMLMAGVVAFGRCFVVRMSAAGGVLHGGIPWGLTRRTQLARSHYTLPITFEIVDGPCRCNGCAARASLVRSSAPE